MRALYILLMFMLASCWNNSGSEQNTAEADKPVVVTQPEKHTEIYWAGFIDNTIPIFLHYFIDSNVIVGEITYLNTKEKKPIKVIGTIEEDSTYRILEFEANGNITGIITGSPHAKDFNGIWFSPKTREELNLSLQRKDTIVKAVDIWVNKEAIFGRYHYQYTEEGYIGNLEISRIGNDKAAFSLFSVTGAPARNIADVPTDTIPFKGNSLVYTIPESDSCSFKVSFYKGFAVVVYTNGYCSGQFGMNATVDGIFIKQSEE